MAPRCLTPKIILSVLTLLFWGAAAGLIFVGVMVYSQYKHYEQIGQAMYTLLPATIMMALGVFFFVLGLVGCIGAFKEQRCLLGVYFTILLIILVGMVIITALGYEYRMDVKKSVKDGITEGLKKYGNDTTYTTEVDFMQKNLKCCGMHNHTDWLNTQWHEEHPNMTYPESCCAHETCIYHPVNGTDPNLYTRGCYHELHNEFMHHLTIIASTAATFAIVLILGMVCACALICRRGNNNPYLGMTSSEHLEV